MLRGMREVAQPSVLSSWTRVIIDALDALGIDPVPVLTDGGFSLEAFRDPNARMPAIATARLWRRASQQAGDPAFGLFASRFVQPTTFPRFDLDAFDPDLGIDWPTAGSDGSPLTFIRSPKDAAAPRLRELR